jgi:hypothetical protein
VNHDALIPMGECGRCFGEIHAAPGEHVNALVHECRCNRCKRLLPAGRDPRCATCLPGPKEAPQPCTGCVTFPCACPDPED